MVPSRDHTPTTSSAGSKVKRELPPPVVLSIQTSTLLAFWSLISSATRLPSGESVGLYITAGSPIRPSSLPDRSIQVSAERAAPTLVLYINVPFCATATAAQYVAG